MGLFPAQATVAVAKGIAEAENIFDFEQAYVNVRSQIAQEPELASNLDVLVSTGCALAFEPKENVDMIVCMTENGKIARYLSKQRPRQPILACSTVG